MEVEIDEERSGKNELELVSELDESEGLASWSGFENDAFGMRTTWHIKSEQAFLRSIGTCTDL